MAEINLLLALGNHENILSVVGVCTLPSDSDDAVAQSPLMITEFMVYGDLLHFLWDSRDVRHYFGNRGFFLFHSLPFI